MAKVKEKKKKIAGKNQLSGFLDVITPSVINFQPKQLNYGDRFQRVLVITDYPQRVGEAWLSRIANIPGVVTSMHTEPIDPYDLVNEIRVSMGELGAKIENMGNPVSRERAQDQYDDAKAILKKIDREQQKVMLMTVVLLVSAEDLDELNTRCRRVESMLAAAGLRARTPMFLQEEGLRTVGPWGMMENRIKDIGARNMPAESVAAGFPFVYSGLNDGEGILLGTDKGGGIILCDFWTRRESRTNSNLTVIGRPGVGKSTAVKKILRGEYGRGTKIIIIDPEDEYGDLARNMDGDAIDCGGSQESRINPLQIRDVPLDDKDEDVKEKLYEEVEGNNSGPLAYHFQFLRTFFKLYLGNISRRNMSLLEVALEALYNSKGINWATNPQDIPNEQYPTLKDLYFILLDLSKENVEELTKKWGDLSSVSLTGASSKDWLDLSILLRSAAVGADSFLWSGPTTINPKSDFVVLNIKNLLEANDEIRRAQFYNVLGWAWNEVSKNRKEKVLLGVDECYLLIDPEVPETIKFLRNTSKRIRKYEGGLMVITQDLVDFLDPAVKRYGQALLNNPVYKILLGQGEKDIEALEKLMTLSEREIHTLSEGNRGEALFIAGNRRMHLKIDISPEELIMFGEAGGR
ncbi:VirB4 family type IV secretion system protein [Bacillus thuringiensis]|uniref:VirB4 family type IV secretion system protein n=1 Tax=Bacillus thuringiensis TaxID=1428 RepID=UPI002FBF0D67